MRPLYHIPVLVSLLVDDEKDVGVACLLAFGIEFFKMKKLNLVCVGELGAYGV